MNINKILIVGCGGGGAMLLPALAPAYDLIIADFDEYEDKNVTRQFYANGAIGEKKSDVLAKFFNKGHKTVESHPKKIFGGEEFEGVDLIISCVDTNQGRNASRDLSDGLDVPLIVIANEDWDPMAWLYLPHLAGMKEDPFIRWGLGTLEDGVRETCAGTEIIAEIPQLPQANYASGAFALCIMQSLLTCKKESNYIAEITATPNPVTTKMKQIV